MKKSQIPLISENPDGLHQRYLIKKIVRVFHESPYSNKPVLDLREVDPNAEYFVMRLDTGGSDLAHVKSCRIGIHAYAEAIKDHIPGLAQDLKERYPLL